MDTWMWVVIVLVAIIAVAFGVVAWPQARRKRLRDTFGPHTKRVLADAPSRREAESELDDRQKRREELDVHPLSSDAAERYVHEWEGIQVRFVDDPVGAMRDADRLVQQVMSDRGDPMDDFESRADLISVDHPTVVENYREEHTTAQAYDRGEASTMDLREAMVRYRSLFQELVSTGERTHEEVR